MQHLHIKDFSAYVLFMSRAYPRKYLYIYNNAKLKRNSHWNKWHIR